MQNFSLKETKTRFANLQDDLYLAGPSSGMHTSRAQRQMKQADSIARLIPRNNSAVVYQNLNEITGHVCYVVLFLQTKLHVLPKNPSSPKLPAFKVGRGLGCIQSASEQNNRPGRMSCYTETCVPLFSKIISRFGPKMRKGFSLH